MDTVSIAVIGVGGFGGQTLEALLKTERAHVVGVADRDPSVAEDIGKRFKLPFYSDNRSLLAETRPQAVYIATPPLARPELIHACSQRGIHVWTESPLARNLDEGLAMVRCMEEAGLKLVVGTQRRFAAGYRRAWELISDGRLGEVFLARTHYLFNWGPDLGWRGDKASGGGALLELGYQAIDLLVWMLGLPEDVYGFAEAQRRPAPREDDTQMHPVYDTDDTAVAVLRYPNGPMASVVTTRRSGPVSEELNIHGRAGSLAANTDHCWLRDPDGHLLDQVESATPLEMFCRQADDFVRAIREDAERYECSGRENWLNLAVIEAIYLSGRTGQPESPRRLLETRELSLADCLQLRPVSQDA